MARFLLIHSVAPGAWSWRDAILTLEPFFAAPERLADILTAIAREVP